ncbi:hypothetical protein [Streptomyces sp. NPDC056169]|uniref:hypothetical protein n=1 Tax=Streptomyces sp. NPDC056169 TaxID=3345734 RepID=UPI0035E1B5E5
MAPSREANPLPADEAKPAEEGGFFVHPELNGEPAERSVSALVAWAAPPDAEPKKRDQGTDG